MDYHTLTDHWEEEIHGIDSNMWCNLLWTVIPLSGQVSIQILQAGCSYHQLIVVSSSLMTCTSFKAMTMLHF